MVSQGKLPVTPTLCNCDTVWKEAAFFLLCLVSAFGSIAKITQKSKTQPKHTHIVQFLVVVERFSIKYLVRLVFFTHIRADVVLKKSSHQFVGGFLEEGHHRLIQRISVLVQPACDVVRHLQHTPVS